MKTVQQKNLHENLSENLPQNLPKNLPKNLKDILSDILKNKLKISDYDTLLLASNWIDICGKDLGGKTKPKYIKGKTLTILTDSSVLSFELNFLKDEFIQKINDHLTKLNENHREADNITDIKFKNIDY
jgi:hypothetical protein